jgi:Fe-S cluster assembly scaffold protein SufB
MQNLEFWTALADSASKSMKDPEWLHSIRIQALHNFIAQPWPVQRDSPGVTYSKMQNVEFEKIKFGSSMNISSNSKSAKSLATSLEFIKSYFGKLTNLKDKTEAMLAAFASDGFVCVVAEDETIHIDLSSEQPVFAHNIIIVKPGISANILLSDSSKHMLNSTLEVFVEEDANLNIVHISRSQSINSTKLSIARDAQVKWFDCLQGSDFTKIDETMQLDGEGGNLSYACLYLGSEAQHIDLSNTAIHNAPNTRCNILAKAALGGFAKGVYRGMIRIAENAPKSSSRLTQKVLLLSEDAHSNAIPGLDINNNDVQAAHAASTEYVTDDQLFYMQSRGFSKEEAQKLIAKGFLASVVGQLPVLSAEQEVRKMIEGVVDA